MNGKSFLGILFLIIVVGLLGFYWFFPYGDIEFSFQPRNYNFSLGVAGSEEMQFYPNMRFSEKKISYKINDCPLQKESDAIRAFNEIENLTILDFYSTSSGEQISVTCDENKKIEGNLFIAGEGGPSNITQSGEFNVILNGKILLIEESSCPEPNVAIHELFHVLGFDHSENKNNIMYPVSKCSQTIGTDMTDLINELYSVPSQPDLMFENTSASMKGKYLDLNLNVRNGGLKSSGNGKIIVSSGSTTIREIDLKPLDVGYGVNIKLSSIWVPKISINEITLYIDTSFNELDKVNNKIILNIEN